jgi:tetratricopeptide (TPR) repeat protein
VQRADAERARGELEVALATYREALAIDPEWTPATVGVGEVTQALRDTEFDRLLSKAYGSLGAESFGEVALTEARALAFERRELWNEAIDLYRSVLESDETLLFAQSGLERAQARAGLDAKLSNLLENPALLLTDSVLADARKLLESAAAETPQGPRLEAQRAELGKLITLASQPIAVRLTSDQLTSVTLYRVGSLGVFASRDLELRPGTYTVIGSRDGYRDVRHTFTVRPGASPPPINVICVEPI